MSEEMPVPGDAEGQRLALQTDEGAQVMRPSAREVQLLRGLARQAAWAGRVARGRAGTR